MFGKLGGLDTPARIPRPTTLARSSDVVVGAVPPISEETIHTVNDSTTGTRILLARHAETAAPDRFHGAESDIGLSAWGHEQAEQLGRWLAGLGTSALYCSGLRRAGETAAGIGRVCRLAPTVIAALHERRIGPLSGVSREEGWATYAETKVRWIAGDLEASHPGGE